MTDSPLLQVIIASTRPSRAGGAIGRWFFDLSTARDDLRSELIDLREVNLPLLNEPKQPSEGDYVHAHTRAWSERIVRGDAYAFVIPEYNHSMNAAIKNAIDTLYAEWLRKPYLIVCYGGASRGLRASKALSTSLLSLKMVQAGEISISLGSTPTNEGSFVADERTLRAATSALDELTRLTLLFRDLRH